MLYECSRKIQGRASQGTEISWVILLGFTIVAPPARERHKAHTYAATPKEVPPLLILLMLMLVLERETEFAGGAGEGSVQRMEPFGCGALRFFVIAYAGGRLLPLS